MVGKQLLFISPQNAHGRCLKLEHGHVPDSVTYTLKIKNKNLLKGNIARRNEIWSQSFIIQKMSLSLFLHNGKIGSGFFIENNRIPLN